MTPTRLRLTDNSTKWGLVTKRDVAGETVREWLIDATEANRVAVSANGYPECVTPEEWGSGLVSSATYTVLPGQANADKAGNLLVCLSLTENPEAGSVLGGMLLLSPTEWTHHDGVVAVNGPALGMITRAGW